MVHILKWKFRDLTARLELRSLATARACSNDWTVSGTNQMGAVELVDVWHGKSLGLRHSKTLCG
jgi:hypothetical protein